MDNKNNLIIDERYNALYSLLTAEVLIKLEHDFKWIWVIQTLHHSLYSLCISSLEHGNYNNVLKHNNKAEFIYSRDGVTFYLLTFYDVTYNKFGRYALSQLIDQKEINDVKQSINNFSLNDLSTDINTFDNKRLIVFPDALGRVMEGEYLLGTYFDNNPLVLTDEELKEIDYIHHFKNDYSHFKPKISSINIPKIKKALKIYLNSIEFLLFELSPPIFFDFNKTEELKPVIESIKLYLKTE